LILLFLSLALLVIVVLALLLPALSRQTQTAELNRDEINASIARAQATELQQRLERGEISQEDYTDEQVRLTSSLARDIAKDDDSRELPAASNDANGRWVVWPLAVLIPVAAGALYLTLGNPAAIDASNRAPDMRQVVTRIRQQLSQQPDDARAWFMLGRAHLTLGEYPAAEMALRKSIEIDGNNVDVKIRLADAVALTQGGSLVGEPEEILKSALVTQPNHPQGLWLYGMALNERGESEEAIAVWNRLLPLLASDPQAQVEVQQLIAGAKEKKALAPATAQSGNEAATDNQTAGGSIQVVVDVAPGLATDLPANTAVFVYAKAQDGPPMPLAVVKYSLGDLPLTVTLSDAQAMIETMKISAFEEVIVGARISRSGDPIAQTGDLFFETEGINIAELKQAVTITISEILR